MIPVSDSFDYFDVITEKELIKVKKVIRFFNVSYFNLAYCFFIFLFYA